MLSLLLFRNHLEVVVIVVLHIRDIVDDLGWLLIAVGRILMYVHVVEDFRCLVQAKILAVID